MLTYAENYFIQAYRKDTIYVGFQVSAQPPAKTTAGLIEKETLKKKANIEYRISNNEYPPAMHSVLG